MRLIICIILLTIQAGTHHILRAQEYIPDTMLHVTMKPVQIKAEREWANDTVRYRYNQMKHYITTVMPYVNEAVQMYRELESKTNEGTISRRERKTFVREKEEELRTRFKAEIKELNETQGVLMVKLIARQTGINIYDMVTEYKNRLAATKWQGWAILHGFNLNRQYNPDDNIMMENIMEELGYPLPHFYEERQILTAN